MIFFDHIKGCSKDTASYNTGLWTWIQFAKGSAGNLFKSPYPEIIITKGSNNIGNGSANYLINPDSGSFSKVKTWENDSAEPDATIKSLGQIITSHGPQQGIHKNLTIDEGHTFRVSHLQMVHSGVYFNPTDAEDGLKVSNGNSLIYFLLNASGISVKAATTFEKDVKCEGQIQAVSFNATSDKRAKTNIKRLDQEKALDIVNKLPVYSFNYKKDNIPSIGVLAQEAMVYDGAIPNFSLVNNEQATGENGDYQTVKESKLVYILWAAIQEQSRQINQLKSQLKELQK